jgi:hypothetical protein
VYIFCKIYYRNRRKNIVTTGKISFTAFTKVCSTMYRFSRNSPTTNYFLYVSCAECYQTWKKNVENTHKISFTPGRRTRFSLHWLARNTHLPNVLPSKSDIKYEQKNWYKCYYDDLHENNAYSTLFCKKKNSNAFSWKSDKPFSPWHWIKNRSTGQHIHGHGLHTMCSFFLYLVRKSHNQ